MELNMTFWIWLMNLSYETDQQPMIDNPTYWWTAISALVAVGNGGVECDSVWSPSGRNTWPAALLISCLLFELICPALCMRLLSVCVCVCVPSQWFLSTMVFTYTVSSLPNARGVFGLNCDHRRTSHQLLCLYCVYACVFKGIAYPWLQNRAWTQS